MTVKFQHFWRNSLVVAMMVKYPNYSFPHNYNQWIYMMPIYPNYGSSVSMELNVRSKSLHEVAIDHHWDTLPYLYTAEVLLVGNRRHFITRKILKLFIYIHGIHYVNLNKVTHNFATLLEAFFLRRVCHGNGLKTCFA